MGILYESVMQQKRNILIKRLSELNISKAQSGKRIHDCDYEELKYELVLASFREINTEGTQNNWF
ncbi:MULTISPECIES: hypothetical protein [Cytobacillus]|uniref:hypothetical protein n=1 Tax=Cytobacillus TaxID=2675230 RepID=UPI0013D61A26|nr:hypothetical protein [Cytobacillus oceanisediminis]MBU8732352.1 hypothetical protein [Cytobacillus oceanisediminis]MDK7666531.1 hypothetical protein [Cytobacillus oceanisediminis]